MILDDLEAIHPPDDEWLTRVRRGHFVWCVKHQCYAKIDFAWEPPDPGCVSGTIGLSFCWREGDDWGTGHIQKWFIKPDGKGFDGSLLLMPVEGNCPDEAREISEPWVRRIERTIGQLIHRLEQLESKIDFF